MPTSPAPEKQEVGANSTTKLAHTHMIYDNLRIFSPRYFMHEVPKRSWKVMLRNVCEYHTPCSPPFYTHVCIHTLPSLEVGEVSNDVLSFLSASAEYHLLDVINDANNFRARGKRSRLTVDDVNASLDLRGAEVGGTAACSGRG